MEAAQVSILIVDDDPGDILFIREMLSMLVGLSIDCSEANSLGQALVMLEHDSFDIVFLDLFLPDNKDLSAISKIRRLDDVVPILILSGLDDIEKSISAMDEGAEFYLVKNHVSARVLERIINYCIHAKKQYLETKQANQIRSLLDSTEDPQLVMTSDGKVGYMNPACEKLHRHYPKMYECLQPFLDERHMQVELCLSNDDSETCLHTHRIPIQWGTQTGTLFSLRDISHYKAVVSELNEANRNIQMLLRELQHRVINSFTMLISILNLIKDTRTEQDQKQLLEDVEYRVRSILLLYKQIYYNNELEHIKLMNYLDKLLEAFPYISIDVQSNCPVDFEMATQKALSIGLVIVELITNSMKHAFDDLFSGTISIIFQLEAERFCIDYQDNGKGFGEKNESDTRYGLSMIDQLIRSLKGTVEIHGDKGFHAAMEFPLP